MPVAELDVFSDLGPENLIGGENGAPAFQTVGGRFEQVPRAEVNTPTELGAFADLIPAGTPSANSMEDVGPFDDLVPKPSTETEKALAETPSGSPLMDPEFTKQFSTPKPGERPPLAMQFANVLDWFTGKFGVPPVAKELVEKATVEPKPEGPSFMNLGIPMIPPQEGTAEQIAAGAANVPIGFANFLLSPGGTTTLAGLGLLPKAGQVLAGLGFTGEQIKGFFQAETLQDKITSGVGALLLGWASAKGIADIRTKPPQKPQESSESPPATTERPAEQTQQGVTADVRDVRPEARPEQRLVPVEEIPRETSSLEGQMDQSGPARTDQTSFVSDVPTQMLSEVPRPSPKITAEIDANARLIERVPENLTRSPEVERLINEPEAQMGPQMKLEPATEGGALGFGGGKRAKVQPKGTTPRGDTEFLKIESGPKRIFKGLEREGAADIIGRTKNKVGKLLSEATDRHVDIEQELTGRLSTEFQRPLKSLSRKATEKAFDEVAAYEAAEQNGRPLPKISPEAQNIISAWENIAERTGKIMAANGVQVLDPGTGKYRPTIIQGKKYRPRMFKLEVEEAMRNPSKNSPLFNDLVTDLAKQRGISEMEAATALRAEAGRFSSSGFMGAIDMARTSKMPESFYEYDLRNIASRYIPQFSERMAQIIAFGQRLGPREAPVRQNLWDIARKEAADIPTQELLNVIEDQSMNVRPKTFGGRFMTGAQTAATGAYLSAPTTTLRNLISGLTATPELLGVRRSVQGLARIIRNRQAFGDAREVGVIRDSIATVLHADKLGDSFVHGVIRSGTDKALKYSGHSPSESFVRTHGFITADIFAKDAVKALNKKPTSMRSKEALGLFKRMGVDAAKIVAEKGVWETGPETRKFIRTFVRETQGGYRYNQTPLWTNSNNGRFLYQFGRWGAMKSRNIARNGIKPLLGEEVQWHGKTMMRRMNVAPLLKMALTPVVLGETFAGLAQLMFGRDRKDSSISEIVAAWKEDEKKAILMSLERVANDVIMAGTLGIWGQPLDWAKSLAGQSRLKNPAEPPGLGSIRALHDLGQKALDQGGQVTRRDILDFTNAFMPGLKQTHDIYRNIKDEPLYEAENDVKTLRAAAHRWADDSGLDVSKRAKGDFRKSPMAPEYEPIKEALLVGDSKRASFLIKTFLDKAENRELAAKSLKASIKMSQPFRAGPYTAKVHRDNFMEWAKKNLNTDDLNQAQRIQSRYKQAAVAAELW